MKFDASPLKGEVKLLLIEFVKQSDILIYEKEEIKTKLELSKTDFSKDEML